MALVEGIERKDKASDLGSRRWHLEYNDCCEASVGERGRGGAGGCECRVRRSHQ